MNQILQLVEKFTVVCLVLHLFTEIIPARKYKKYVSLFGRLFLVLIMIQETTTCFTGGRTTLFDKLNSRIKLYENCIQQNVTECQNTAKIAENRILSTIEENVKSRYNNINSKCNISKNTVKSRVSEEFSTVEGQRDRVCMTISGITVDKSANISVNTVIVRQIDEDGE